MLKNENNVKGTGYLVKCPGCGGKYHETTEEFDNTRAANGRMFKLLASYGPMGANWTTFAADEELKFGSLTCPGCGCPYTLGGMYVTVVKMDETGEDDAPFLDTSLHLDYRLMVEAGMFQPVDEVPSGEGKASRQVFSTLLP